MNGPARNVELKVRLDDMTATRTIAERIATGRGGTQRQVDTYFVCRSGRLKLREIDGREGELIAYQRPNESHARLSRYHRVGVTQCAALKKALAAALGIRGVVDKSRAIYFWHNVRIHLDEVVELGNFLEFEAVLGAEVDEARGREQLASLAEEFELDPARTIGGSYADLLDDLHNQ